MADIDNNNSQYAAENSWIGKCTVTFVNGDQKDIKPLVVEISLFEDMFSFCCSGYIMVRDSVGLINMYQCNGGESIELQFDNIQNPNAPSRKFVIYTITDRRPTGNLNGEFYKLYFCNPDLLASEMMRVAKAYDGKLISDMVSDILATFLNTSTNYTKNISPTQAVYKMTMPNYHPYHTISYLSQFAIPATGSGAGMPGSDMLFFENLYGYNFYSASYLASQSAAFIYNYQQNNLDDEVKNLSLEADSVIALEHVRSFDVLRNITTGAYANKVIAVDTITQQSTTYTFDLSSYYKINPPVNGMSMQPPIVSPVGTLNQAYDSHLQVISTNSNEINSPYIQNNGGKIDSDMYTATALSTRTAQLSLLQSTVIKIVVPGTPYLTVGKTIQLNYYNTLVSGQSRQMDNQMSGVYLITAVRHIIQSNGVYHTVLEISKSTNMVS